MIRPDKEIEIIYNQLFENRELSDVFDVILDWIDTLERAIGYEDNTDLKEE